MKIKILFKTALSITLAFSLLLSLASCFKSQTQTLYPDENIKEVDVLELPEQSFNDVYAEFSSDFIAGALPLANGDNIVVSPISLLAVLNMLSHGTDGETLRQFEELFGMPIDEYSSNIASFIHSLDDNDQASVANSLWIRENFPVKQSYVNDCGRYYLPDVFVSPFNKSTLRDINDWAADKTDGLIKEILKEIDGSAVMFVMNAVLFDAKWETKYEKSDISYLPFTDSDGNISEVKMLMSGESKYLEGEGYTGFSKYYEGKDFSFAALLPDESITPEELIASLGSNIVTAFTDCKNVAVSAYMPCFTAENELDLADMLKSMGLTDAFAPYVADFSKLSDEQGLYIGLIKQNTYIELDENGTKAAAVTIGGVYCESVMIEEKQVILNRPYVYAIIHNETGLPVFIGVTNNAS